MRVRALLRGLVPAVGLTMVGLTMIVACTDPAAMGYDRETDTNAAQVTWSDGKTALSINCTMPGACQTRALRMCKGNFTTLSMDNMPTRGDMTMVRGPASVVVRCA